MSHNKTLFLFLQATPNQHIIIEFPVEAFIKSNLDLNKFLNICYSLFNSSKTLPITHNKSYQECCYCGASLKGHFQHPSSKLVPRKILEHMPNLYIIKLNHSVHHCKMWHWIGFKLHKKKKDKYLYFVYSL